MSCCIAQGTETLWKSTWTLITQPSLCPTSCLWVLSGCGTLFIRMRCSLSRLLLGVHSHPGQIPGIQVPSVTWPATRAVCLWSEAGERERKKTTSSERRPSVATLHHLFCCNHAVCLCRSTNTPIWPSTLFTALWHSKLRLLLCACLSSSPVRLIIFLPGTLPCPRPDPVLAAGWRHSRVPASLHCFLAISFSLAFGPFFSLSSIYVCLPPHRCASAASQVSLCA